MLAFKNINDCGHFVFRLYIIVNKTIRLKKEEGMGVDAESFIHRKKYFNSYRNV